MFIYQFALLYLLTRWFRDFSLPFYKLSVIITDIVLFPKFLSFIVQ